MTDKTVVLDTSEQMAAYVMLQVYYKLKLEAENPDGPRWREAPMKQAKIIMERAGHPTTSRTKKKVLAEYEALLIEARILKPKA
jgi:hypothetical protein